MSASLRKVALRNLAAHKGRLVLTIISVVLGTAFIAGSLVFTGTLGKSFDGIAGTFARGVDIRVSPESDDVPGVPVAVVRQLQGDGPGPAPEGIRAVVPSLGGPIALRDGEGKSVTSSGPPILGGEFLTGAASLDPEPLTISDGRAPRGPGEAVINSDAGKRLDLPVGARTQIATFKVDEPLEVTIVGWYSTPIESGGFVGVFFDHAQAVDLYGDGITYPYVDLAATPGTSPERLREEVLAALGPAASTYQVQTGDEVRDDFRDQAQQALTFINIILLAFGMIGLLVGTFIIYNTFSMLLAQRAKELALLRAIGASARQLRNNVLLEAVAVGLVGSVIGLFVGIGLAAALRALIDAIGGGFPKNSLVISPGTIVVVLAVGTAVTAASALLPALRAARVAPVAAMRDESGGAESTVVRRGIIGAVLAGIAVPVILLGSTKTGGDGASLVGLGALALIAAILVGAPALAGPVVSGMGRLLVRGTTGRLARTNAMRNPRRTAATAFALTLGLALVVIIATLGGSARKSVDALIERGVVADFSISPTIGQLPAGAAGIVDETPGIAKTLSGYDFPAQVSTKDGDRIDAGVAVGGELDGFIELTMVGGSPSLAEHNLVTDDSTATRNGWKLGDTVTVTSWQDPDRSTELTVGGIYDGERSPIAGWLVGADVRKELYPRLTATANIVTIFADLEPGADLHQVKDALEDNLDPLLAVKVQDVDDIRDEAGSLFTIVLGVLYALLALAVIIAILGIINTLALSVLERRREIGMLRAIGMLRKQVRRTIYLESMLVALFGAIVGVALGLFVGWALVRTLRSEGIDQVVIPTGQVIVVVIAAGIVGVVAALLPAIRAARTPPLAAIAEG